MVTHYILLVLASILYGWGFGWYAYLRWKEKWIIDNELDRIANSVVWHRVEPFYNLTVAITTAVLCFWFSDSVIQFIVTGILAVVVKFIFGDGFLNLYKGRKFFQASNQSEADTEEVASYKWKMVFLIVAVLLNVFQNSIQQLIYFLF